MDEGELRAAFDTYARHLRAISARREWHRVTELYTEDAVYRRSGHPELVGRAAIRDWMIEMAFTFPGNQFIGATLGWSAVDPATGRVIFEFRNQMADPGDGSVHQAATVRMLTYAGSGLWSRAEDVRSPTAYAEMVRRWIVTARRCGTFDPSMPA